MTHLVAVVLLVLTSSAGATIAATMGSEQVLTASATTYNPCSCDVGQPLWYYQPGRRTFSFASLSGNVHRFDARCEAHRIDGDVGAGKLWTLPPEWGSCRLFVFGDDGASFDFPEHPGDGRATDAKDAKVVRRYVVD